MVTPCHTTLHFCCLVQVHEGHSLHQAVSPLAVGPLFSLLCGSGRAGPAACCAT